MKIQKITTQHRRDFTAIMECGHCNHTEINDAGYDDDFYHNNVIPKMKCKKCGKQGEENYKPFTPKYSANEIV